METEASETISTSSTNSETSNVTNTNDKTIENYENESNEKDVEKETTRERFKREREEDPPSNNTSSNSSYSRNSGNQDDDRRKRERFDGKFSRDNKNNNDRRGRDDERRNSLDDDRRRRYRDSRSPPNDYDRNNQKRRRNDGHDDRDHFDRDRFQNKNMGRMRGNQAGGYRDRDEYEYDSYNQYNHPPFYDNHFDRNRGKERSHYHSMRDLYEGPLKTYKQFLEMQDDNITPTDAEKKYEDYKNEHNRRQAKIFFDEHKNDEWFKEKYDPTYQEKKRNEKLGISEKELVVFKEMLNDTNYDFNLTSTDHDIESANSAAKDEHENEHDHHEELDNNEKENEKEIKKDEEKSKTESDPSTDTSASSDVKMEDNKSEIEEGSISEEKTTKNEKPNTTEKSDHSGTCIIFVKTLPPNIGRPELIEFFSKVEGFQKITLSEPQRFKNFHRLGWVTYDSPQACLQALNELNGGKIKEFSLQLALNKPGSSSDFYKKAKITPPVGAEESRISIDLDQSKQLCLILDKEYGIHENPLFSSTFNFDSLTPMQQLDRLLIYMRKVHKFCYYCGEEYEDEDELLRKCGQKHLRGKKKESDPPNVITDPWASSLDSKIKMKIEHPEKMEIVSGKLKIEKKLEKFYSTNVNRIDEEKFRCGVCNKLFCGDAFVKKHLAIKHPEKTEEIKQSALESQYLENYLKDSKKMLQLNAQPPYNINPNMNLPMGMNVVLPNMNNGMMRQNQNNRRFGSGGMDYRGSTPPGVASSSNVPYYNNNQQQPYFNGNNNMRRMSNNNNNNRRGNQNNRPMNNNYKSPNNNTRNYTPRQNRNDGNTSENASSPTSPSSTNQNVSQDVDPRGIIAYVDLDAPSEDSIQIDYGTPKSKK